MSKKTIAVIIGAALVAFTAGTATASALNGAYQASIGTPRPAVTTTSTVPVRETSGSPAPVAPGAPWMSPDTTSSVLTTGTPFGWTVRMLAHMAHGADATGAPFGRMISYMARVRNSECATIPVPAALAQAQHDAQVSAAHESGHAAGPRAHGSTIAGPVAAQAPAHEPAHAPAQAPAHAPADAPAQVPAHAPAHDAGTASHSGGMMGTHN